MLQTPLNNSKNVNKPFQSPFDSSVGRNNEKSANTTSKQSCERAICSLRSSRSLEAKQILLLDEDENKKKKQRIAIDEKIKISKNLSKSDLLVLKRKVFEIRKEIDSLKSQDNCAKKHNPKNLKISINKWKLVCQNTLVILCTELKNRGEKNSNISDILNNLGIPETIVDYSKKDDAFL